MPLVRRHPEHSSVCLTAEFAVAHGPDVRNDPQRVEVAEHGMNPLPLLNIERKNVALAAAQYVERVSLSAREMPAHPLHRTRQRPPRIPTHDMLALLAVLTHLLSR